VTANARDYLEQVGRLIDLEKAEVHHNGDWFARWSFLQVLDLTRKMTLGQITAREDFANRMAAAKPVYLHECLYPLMQGWDSVEIRADVELGGTEQLFSLLVARDLQEGQGQEPQVALTMPILVGTDGVRRMGKSLGNYIGVGESAENQFGKIMSVPDEPMRQYFTLLTEIPLEEVDRLLSQDVNPRDAKEILGKAIVTQYHGEEAAVRAALEFRRRAAGEDPDEIPDVGIDAGKLDHEGRMPAFQLVKELGLETSGANARRVIEQGGVSISLDSRREPVTDPKAFVYVREGLIVRVGKRKIARVRLV
jgi:tyrosyl-tRNA synthetase